ncbi:unnamed protein product [Triticum turgidum subsp. durum]|uniref:Lipoyl-binding domain-containing protein n=1 Tax=Triticum turgidum subsp. durum TaxID=4567 RepID=A0A9R0TIC7_TRITD|nr:unnamed protein product [Triticum turgidum subsp. durum]
MVAAALDARLRDHLLAKPNLFTEAASSAASSFQRPVLCLFDRNFELSVGIQHDWSYRPLVHDVLSFKLNKLKLPTEKYDLDDSDPFWVANSWSPFPKVAEEIEAQLAKYKQDVDEVNQRTGGGRDGVEFDGTDLIGNTKHLMNAVNSLPELTERKKMIDKHTNIATALLGHIKERSLDGYYECENDMLVNGTVDRNMLLSLLRGKGTKEDKLRLAVTYLLSFEAPLASELEQVEAALRESEVDMSAFQYVKRIKSLNTQFAAASSTASRSNIVDWAEKLYGQSISAVTAGVKNLLSDGRQLALTRTVEALMEGKPNPEVDNYLLFDPRAPRSGTGGQFRGPFREAIVFMIGGGNYIEYRSLVELGQRSQPSKHVIYGATEILNGVEFIQQLAELGQKAGLGGVLLADTPCKLLLVLIADGSHVVADTPYAEVVEVMKMCMPLLLPASGVIHFVMSEGQAMQASGLIARWDLVDPSTVGFCSFNKHFLVLIVGSCYSSLAICGTRGLSLHASILYSIPLGTYGAVVAYQSPDSYYDVSSVSILDEYTNDVCAWHGIGILLCKVEMSGKMKVVHLSKPG